MSVFQQRAKGLRIAESQNPNISITSGNSFMVSSQSRIFQPPSVQSHHETKTSLTEVTKATKTEQQSEWVSTFYRWSCTSNHFLGILPKLKTRSNKMSKYCHSVNVINVRKTFYRNTFLLTLIISNKWSMFVSPLSSFQFPSLSLLSLLSPFVFQVALHIHPPTYLNLFFSLSMPLQSGRYSQYGRHDSEGGCGVPGQPRRELSAVWSLLHPTHHLQGGPLQQRGWSTYIYMCVCIHTYMHTYRQTDRHYKHTQTKAESQYSPLPLPFTPSP